METKTEPASFEDRVLLGIEQLHMTYVSRKNFLRDSDLLDVADSLTTDAPCENGPDYDALVDRFWTEIFGTTVLPWDRRS